MVGEEALGVFRRRERLLRVHEVGDRLGPRLGDRVDTVVGTTLAIAQVDRVVRHRARQLEAEGRVHFEIVREELVAGQTLFAREEEDQLVHRPRVNRLKRGAATLHTLLVLTDHQRAEFEDCGFLRLRNVFTDDEAGRMRGVVWRELERRHGVVEADRATWKIEQPSAMTTSKKHPAFDPIGGPALVDAADTLLGDRSWRMPKHWGQVMVTFPQGGAPWTLPGKLWHIDFPYTNEPTPLFALKVFAFFGDGAAAGRRHARRERLAPCRPTLRRRPHRPKRAPTTAACRAAIHQADPWFRALAQTDDPDPERNARFMESDHDDDGIRVRSRRAHRRPGDVVVTHPWTLHHAAPNRASYPRLMRSKAIYRAVIDQRELR